MEQAQENKELPIYFLKLHQTVPTGLRKLVGSLFLWVKLVHRGVQQDIEQAPRAAHEVIAEN